MSAQGEKAAAGAAPESVWERWFHLKEHGTNARTEVVAGLATFMTMAYIIFVNPSILSEAGMPFDGVVFATVAAAVVGTLLMAFLANYPFGLAPGLGLNAYFAYTVVLGLGYDWRVALGAVFLSGVVFIFLTVLKVREAIVNAIPGPVKVGVAAGIGLFIALIGMNNAGFVVPGDGTILALGDVTAPPVLLAAAGLLITGALMALKVNGAILWGILITSIIGWVSGVAAAPTGVIGLPDFSAWGGVFGQLDIGSALQVGVFEIIFVFLFVDVFDTVGTLVGVSTRAGFLDAKGRLPKAGPALLADAVATAGGAVFGTSTTTTYVESAAGVAAGGRTGMTGLVVAAGFFLSLFFLPIIGAVPAEATAPALILVGVMMMQAVRDVEWEDMADAIPVFLAITSMAFTFSIATGIALAFISYALIRLLSGRGREVSVTVYVLAALFILRFAYLGG